MRDEPALLRSGRKASELWSAELGTQWTAKLEAWEATVYSVPGRSASGSVVEQPLRAWRDSRRARLPQWVAAAYTHDDLDAMVTAMGEGGAAAPGRRRRCGVRLQRPRVATPRLEDRLLPCMRLGLL